ncbi:hypothetical protein OJAV_G00184360 [Oryzias javanicus]|uniref:Uncharacterized protein n=1 Tax=Oryzias javanicus TaxID=123683 RepID=A0A3S2PTV5_ORYJA|nr:hypothetical protein OJAV_G00184360 [Oryzias javanicus]
MLLSPSFEVNRSSHLQQRSLESSSGSKQEESETARGCRPTGSEVRGAARGPRKAEASEPSLRQNRRI